MNSVEKNKDTQYLILYFQVHQPRRLHSINLFDIADSPHYFNDSLNESIVRRIARDCYLPTNKLLLELIREFPRINITFSISGVVIEQLEAYAPEALESFRKLAETGCVKFLSETYYHSLASLVNSDEFESVHSYFSPFPSSYEAFINYMNAVTHVTFRINEEKNKQVQDVHDLSSTEAERQNVKVATPVWVMNLESIPKGNVPDVHG